MIFWPDEPGHCAGNSLASVFSDIQIKKWRVNNDPYQHFHKWLKNSKIDSLHIYRSEKFDACFNSECRAYLLANKADCVIVNNENYNQARLEVAKVFNGVGVNPLVNSILEDYENKAGCSLNLSIGMHIRRGDMASNVKYFRRCVKTSEYSRIIEANPDNSFYISTDQPDVFLDLKKRFGRRVFRMEIRSFNRNDADILMAMCELVALSRTQKIYGGQSCFSRAASIVGNIDMILLGQRLQNPE